MRAVLLPLGLIFLVVGCEKPASPPSDRGQDAPGSSAPEDRDPKDIELEALPVGLRVTHDPNPVAAQRGGRSGSRYTWLYETRVAALSEDVTIFEFGSLSRNPARGNRWELSTIYKRPFNAAELADWYSCPGALVRAGSDCADARNYSGSDKLAAFEARWYFIGRTPSGKLVKGEATIQALPEVTPRPAR